MRSSTRATSLGWLRARKQSGRCSGLSLMNVPAGDHLVAEAVVLLLRAVAPVDLVRLAELGHLVDPGDESLCLVGAADCLSGRRERARWFLLSVKWRC